MKRSKLSNYILGAVIGSAAMPSLFAASYTWDGHGPGSSKWSNANMWNGGGPPAGGSTSTDVHFSGSTQLGAANDLTGTFTLNRMFFDSGAGAFVVSGNAIAFGGTSPVITQNSSSLQTISVGGITLNATTEINGSGSGQVAISAPISGSGVGLIDNKSGTVILSGNNSYTGGTTLTQGTLKLGSTTALPSNASGGGSVILNGGTLEINNQNVTGSRILGALTLQNSSSILLSPDTTHTGSITFSSASWTGGLLKILGWTGPGINQAGTDDRIFISGTVGSGFLADVQFYSDINGNNPIGTGGRILSGELVPAPEPINVALGVFAAGFLGFNVTRRYLRKSPAAATPIAA